MVEDGVERDGVIRGGNKLMTSPAYGANTLPVHFHSSKSPWGHYRELKAWQVAHELALEVSRAVDAFPQHERFELTSQLRRASLSVPTNLAEGQGRFGPREALRFTRIAAGSLVEVDYLLFFAKEKGYLDPQIHDRLIVRRRHASRLINRLARSLQSAIPKRPRSS